MIQRIQTIWLFLAALMGAGLFMFDLYAGNKMVDGVTVKESINALNNYALLLIAVVVTILPLIAIFMFKSRKRQKMMSIMSIVANIGFIALTIMLVGNFTNENATTVSDGGYRAGAVMPVLAIVFLIFAIRGINKDQKLIKSLDRLR